MKFTYYSLAAASAVSSLEISDFNVSNIKLVENSINSKLRIRFKRSESSEKACRITHKKFRKAVQKASRKASQKASQ